MAATPEQVDYVKKECMSGDTANTVSADNAMDHLIAHHKALKQTHHGLMASKEAVDTKLTQAEGLVASTNAKLTETTGKLAAAEQKASAFETKNLELSKSLPKSHDPEVLFERRLRLVDTRKDRLVERLGVDHADKLIAATLGTEQSPNGFMLSRDSDARDCRAADILDIVLSAPVTPGVGSRTPAQVLPRQLPTDPSLQASKDAEQPNPLLEYAKTAGIPLASK